MTHAEFLRTFAPGADPGSCGGRIMPLPGRRRGPRASILFPGSQMLVRASAVYQCRTCLDVLVISENPPPPKEPPK